MLITKICFLEAPPPSPAEDLNTAAIVEMRRWVRPLRLCSPFPSQAPWDCGREACVPAIAVSPLKEGLPEHSRLQTHP